MNRRRFIKTGLLWLATPPAIIAATPQQVLLLSKPPAAPAASAGYTAYATTFAGDGQCWMERDADLTGVADGKAGTISFWVKFNGDDGVLQYLVAQPGSRVSFTKQTANTLRFSLSSPAAVELVRINSSSTLTADASWHHVICSWDKSVETRHGLYIDGVDRASVATFLSDDVDSNTEVIDYTRSDLGIGANVGGGATTDLNADLAEFWFSFTEYIDLSVSANLLKFRSAGGKPVSLGTDGSIPTGTAPAIYFKSPYSSFTTNSGSGGNFTKYGTTAFVAATPP